MADKPNTEMRFEIDEDLSNIEIPGVLPVLPLRGIVIFPYQPHPFLVSRQSSLKLIEDFGQAQKVIALAAQKNPEEENPGPEGLFERGTAVRILRMLRYPDQACEFWCRVSRIEISTLFSAIHISSRTRLASPRSFLRTRKSMRCTLIWWPNSPSSSRWYRTCPTSCR